MADIDYFSFQFELENEGDNIGKARFILSGEN